MSTTANYILKIFKANPYIVMSWGAHNFKALEDGLSCLVQGYKHNGVVKILYDASSDTFTVRLEKRDGNLCKEQHYVYFDELVDVIDEMVERTDDYEERVKKEYGIISI